jgi:hypothetical protein
MTIWMFFTTEGLLLLYGQKIHKITVGCDWPFLVFGKVRAIPRLDSE